MDKEKSEVQNEKKKIREDEWEFTGHGKSWGAFPQVTTVPLDEEGVERTRNELSNAIHAFLENYKGLLYARRMIVDYVHHLDEIPQNLQHKVDLVLRL